MYVYMRQVKKANENWAKAVMVWTALGFVLAQFALVLLPIPKTPAFLKERFGCRLWPGVPPLVASIINCQVNNCADRRSSTDVLLLGDSSCLMSLKPAIIQEKTGLSCWNMGTIGYLRTAGHAAILDLWIKQCGPPRLLVYHFVPYSINENISSDEVWLKAFKDWIAADDSSKSTLMDSLPTEGLRKLVLFRLAQFARKFADEEQNLKQPRGVYPSDNEVASLLRENRGWMPESNPILPREKWKCEPLKPFSQDCVDGLKRIFAMSQKYKFPVLLVMNDVPDVYPDQETANVYAAYENSLKQTVKPYSNVYLSSPFYRRLSAEYCASYNHVTPAGALIHSNEVAQYIKRLSETLAIAPGSKTM